jgi:hypothetical protein
MKKIILVAVSILMITGVALADKGKKKKCAKGKTCCSKEKKACCKKDKASETTAKM